MKVRLALVCSLCLLLAACGNYKMFGSDEHSEEDWVKYDYVFSGDSPDTEGEPMYFKLNVNDGGAVTGETMGVFYAEVAGTLDVQNIITLEMTWLDHMCESDGYATFIGELSDDTLTGAIMVQSCEIWDFAYTGELVGGRLFE